MDRIVIFNRFKEIAETIRNKDVKQVCDDALDAFEKIDPELADMGKVAERLFEEIDTTDTYEVTRKLYELIDSCKHNAKALGLITKAWDSFHEKIKKSKRGSLYTSSELAKVLLKNHELNLMSKENLDLEFSFKYYPCLLRAVLEGGHIENELQPTSLGNAPEIINNLKNILNKHSNNREFVQQCLHSTKEILNGLVYFIRLNRQGSTLNGNNNLSEIDKDKLLNYKYFFQIFEQYLPSVNDKNLILDIKILCANLPCFRRSEFPHLLLSKKEQLDVLIEKLQNKEDDKIQELIKALGEWRDSKDSEIPLLNKRTTHYLVKLVGTKSRLSTENRLLLRNALTERLKMELSWDDSREITKRFVETFRPTQYIQPCSGTNLLVSLKRISKTKSFFENQTALDESTILIPYWYHSTQKIYSIVTAGEIEVRQESGLEGAWVSSRRECLYGPYVFAFGENITSFNSCLCNYKWPDFRWRGVLENIPLRNTTNLVLIGVPNYDKESQKQEKLQLISALEEKEYQKLKVFSVDQVDFIQKEVSNILGTPNLSDRWWG
jgi:hypothetical protein